MATRRAPVFQWRLRLARHVAAPAASGDDEMDPQPRNTFNVAVIGAGLSGLCLAQSLKKSGIDVHVYERDDSAETRGQGYRITLDERGIRALEVCLPDSLFALFEAASGAPGGFYEARFAGDFPAHFHSIKGPKPVPATPGRPVDTASNSFVWSRGSGVFWQAVHACRGHGPRGDGPLCGWHVRGCNGSGRRGRGRLAGPAVAPAECSAGLARVQCDLWKDESQHNRSSTSSWEARDEWCPGDWIARQDVLFHDDGIPGAAP